MRKYNTKRAERFANYSLAKLTEIAASGSLSSAAAIHVLKQNRMAVPPFKNGCPTACGPNCHGGAEKR